MQRHLVAQRFKGKESLKKERGRGSQKQIEAKEGSTSIKYSTKKEKIWRIENSTRRWDKAQEREKKKRQRENKKQKKSEMNVQISTYQNK